MDKYLKEIKQTENEIVNLNNDRQEVLNQISENEKETHIYELREKDLYREIEEQKLENNKAEEKKVNGQKKLAYEIFNPIVMYIVFSALLLSLAHMVSLNLFVFAPIVKILAKISIASGLVMSALSIPTYFKNKQRLSKEIENINLDELEEKLTNKRFKLKEVKEKINELIQKKEELNIDLAEVIANMTFKTEEILDLSSKRNTLVEEMLDDLLEQQLAFEEKDNNLKEEIPFVLKLNKKDE